jgi:hypothetical protein
MDAPMHTSGQGAVMVERCAPVADCVSAHGCSGNGLAARICATPLVAGLAVVVPS